MPYRRLNLAIAGVLLASAPVAASAADTQAHDARCAYVKSAILGKLIQEEEPDQQLVAGVTAHVLYYFGRLDASLERQAISDLILAEALKFETFDEVGSAEKVCDAEMQATIGFMSTVGERLTANGR